MASLWEVALRRNGVLDELKKTGSNVTPTATNNQGFDFNSDPNPAANDVGGGGPLPPSATQQMPSARAVSPMAQAPAPDASPAGPSSKVVDQNWGGNRPTPGGFDPNKWSDPAHQTPKYVVGRILAAGGSVAEAAAAIGGRVDSDPRFIIMADGTRVKVQNSEGVIQWYVYDGNGNASTNTTIGDTGSVGAGAGTGGGTANAANDALTAQFRDTLLKMLQGNSDGPINPTTDANLAPQAAAYKTAQEQGQSQQRAAIAERLAAEGLNPGGQGSGAFDAQLSALSERTGQNIGTFNAGLVGNEVQARRQRLTQALELANAFGARTESLALQKQLAEMDNTYRYSALGQQQGQFEDRTAFDYASLRAELDRQAILQAMG